MVRLHRADHAEVIHALGQMREECTDLRTAFPVRSELPLRGLEEHLKVPLTALKFVNGNGLARCGPQLGLGIPRIDMRHAAAQVEEDYALCLGRKVRRPWSEWIVAW